MDEYLLKSDIPEVKISIDDTSAIARIKVIGVGGAGNNVVDELIKSNMDGVEFIAVNTDAQALETSLADIKVQIGDSLCRGLGTGGDPERGKQAAIEDKEKIIEI